MIFGLMCGLGEGEVRYLKSVRYHGREKGVKTPKGSRDRCYGVISCHNARQQRKINEEKRDIFPIEYIRTRPSKTIFKL
jgi:hypothetical protein